MFLISQPSTHTCSVHSYPYPHDDVLYPGDWLIWIAFPESFLSGLEPLWPIGILYWKREPWKRSGYLFPNSQSPGLLWAALSKDFSFLILWTFLSSCCLQPRGETEWPLLTIGQGLSILALWTFWVSYVYAVSSFPVRCTIFSSIPGIYVVDINNICKAIYNL